MQPPEADAEKAARLYWAVFRSEIPPGKAAEYLGTSSPPSKEEATAKLLELAAVWGG